MSELYKCIRGCFGLIILIVRQHNLCYFFVGDELPEAIGGDYRKFVVWAQ